MWLNYVVLIIFCLYFPPSYAFSSYFTSNIESSKRPEKVLLDILVGPLVPISNASTQCIKDGSSYVRDLASYSPWALQMYDSSGKLPPGIGTGTPRAIGNYQECLRTKNDNGFAGQACNAIIQFNITEHDHPPRELDIGDLLNGLKRISSSRSSPENIFEFQWMWCVPSTCTHTEIANALQNLLESIAVAGRVQINVQVGENSCRTAKSDEKIWDPADWVYIFILALFILIAAASTIYDLLQLRNDTIGISIANIQESKRTSNKYLTSFSLYTNGKKLLATDRKSEISCLDCLRFLSICWVILGHTFYVELLAVKMDYSSILSGQMSLSDMLFLNKHLATDTFFVLGGTLLTYTLKIKRSRSRSLNIFQLYWHRYVRLTPAYAMVIGFYSTMFYKMGSGPLWEELVKSNRDTCRNSWWTNLLYVNNYVNVDSTCMGQSWYLAVDMQLVWLSPIFLYPMIRIRKSLYFWLFLVVGIIGSILAPFLVTFFNDLTGTMIFYKNGIDIVNVYLQVYTRVYTRAGSYIIGLSLGYLLYNYPPPTIKIRTRYIVCGWIVSTISAVLAVFGPIGMYSNNSTYDKWEASFYAGLHRHAFALAVAWIIFCSVNNYAGPVGKFLSWSGWLPFGKLTYSAYLSHYLILLSKVASANTRDTFSTYHLIHSYFGNLVGTMIISVIVYLMFELPFQSILRLVVSRKNNGNVISTESSKNICDSSNSEPSFTKISQESLCNNNEKESNGISSIWVVEHSGEEPWLPSKRSSHSQNLISINSHNNIYENYGFVSDNDTEPMKPWRRRKDTNTEPITVPVDSHKGNQHVHASKPGAIQISNNEIYEYSPQQSKQNKLQEFVHL